MDKKDVGALVRAKRKQAKKTLKEAATLAGVKLTQVQNIEAGKSDTKIKTLDGIARALGGELIVDIRLPGDVAPDPLVEDLARALPHLPDHLVRAIESIIAGAAVPVTASGAGRSESAGR